MKHHEKCLKSQPPHDVAAPEDVCRCRELLWLDADDAKRQLADTRAILADLLEQRNETWLAQLVGRRAELYAWLQHAESAYDPACAADCDQLDRSNHRPGCELAAALRLLGGPEETQRQVDAAHEAAVAYSYDDTARMLRGPSDFLGRYGGARLDFGPRDNRNHATINELIQSGRISLDDARRAIEGASRYTATITGVDE